GRGARKSREPTTLPVRRSYTEYFLSFISRAIETISPVALLRYVPHELVRVTYSASATRSMVFTPVPLPWSLREVPERSASTRAFGGASSPLPNATGPFFAPASDFMSAFWISNALTGSSPSSLYPSG